MRKGDITKIKMRRILRIEGVQDETLYTCELLQYDKQQECIYLVLKSGELTDVSLDAIYNCDIYCENETLNCTGRIRERYNGKAGKTLKLEIENGFYKINLKCVDK